MVRNIHATLLLPALSTTYVKYARTDSVFLMSIQHKYEHEEQL